MKPFPYGYLLASLVLCLIPRLKADIRPAPLFCDGAVLQRGEPVPVWGAAAPGEKVTVEFSGQSASAVAGADGRWQIVLPPLEASATPRDLVLRGNNLVAVKDVLVGEVWLASGQSNMAMMLNQAKDGKAEAKAAAFPLVREFKTIKRSSHQPINIAEGSWVPALPATAGQFSAVAYYFALDLHRKLKVPVGIINSSWGGSRIDPWISRDAYQANPILAPQLAKQDKAPHASDEELAAHQKALREWETKKQTALAKRQPFKEPAPKAPATAPDVGTVTGLNNAMIHPHAPFALRGFIWYQGESNSLQADTYASRFESLITGWRKQFKQEDAPFLWVQIPNFDYGNRNADTWGWAKLREAQTKLLSLPHTGQAVTIDVGEAKEIHPANKKPVGQRLALLAFTRAYGFKDLVDGGPVIKAAVRDGDRYLVSFHPLASPLKAAETGLTGFELAGSDHVFVNADAHIEGDQVVVRSLHIKSPEALRYAFRNAPAAGLFNAAGLPAPPFRTDNW
jgi:sialate O-acetylesterase